MRMDLVKTGAKKAMMAAAVAALLTGASVPMAAPAFAIGPESVADLAEKLLPAVVNISTSQNIKGSGDGGAGVVPMPKLPEGSPFQDFFDQFFDEQQQGDGGGDGGDNGGGGQNSRKVQSLGSGFVVDAAEGIIVTNNHVIADADDIEVNFSDGKKLKATLVGKDAKTDLAVLKVNPAKYQLTAVKFGDSDKARIGDWVMAIGNPFGLGGTVTVGIISARNRDIQSGPYDRFIQTDAAINRGNSGGPLFDLNGDVIGINSAIISPSGGSIGLGFSIPAELASGVVDQLRKFGETRRGWLGVRIQPVTDDIAESLGMANSEGALIAGIIKGSPVDDGTIQAGDVIKKFDGRDIKEVRDLSRMVAESTVGKVVDVVLIRKKQEMTVKVTLGRLEDGEKQVGDTSGDTSGKSADKPAETKVLGMLLGELTDEARKSGGIADDIKGVLITSVEPNSAAAEKQVLPGEIITEVAQESVSSPKEFADKIDALKKDGRKNALLMVSSKTGELRFLTLRIE
jgi:serine protease Do